MAARKKSSTPSDAEPVSGKTEKKAAVARRKTSAVADSKGVGNKRTAAATKKTAAKENPVEVKTGVARKKAPAKPKVATMTAAVGQKPTITGEERHRMICEAAYLISSKRPSCSGSPEIDWVQAEAIIDMLFDATG